MFYNDCTEENHVLLSSYVIMLALDVKSTIFSILGNPKTQYYRIAE
ncbi:hypothetical protein HMPREF1584_00240 [Gardnerella vaginalis JCP8481A]|uniref:Uncharacterized protein n=1 Tax=Gardnerella vaginalis TaxID=2702 RepID=A0A133P2C1_GARVA|nr:hypothetical protein HMPREF1584_00240 [Gardnerella vaginalis JCP8481A]KXA22626.1 hypothetical protein HMPREF3208_00176 [Gardnerella vaginalis]